jgi:hypothetical protein
MAHASEESGKQVDHGRAQQVLVEVWSALSAARDAGEAPNGVVLSPEDYRAVQHYHAHLGTLPNESLDYIGKYELFGVTVFVEPNAAPQALTTAKSRAGGEVLSASDPGVADDAASEAAYPHPGASEPTSADQPNDPKAPE